MFLKELYIYILQVNLYLLENGLCVTNHVSFIWLAATIFTRYSTTTFQCGCFILDADYALNHPSYCWRFVASCCVICWAINPFPSLSSYVTQNRVDAHLFLHPQGISRRENVNPVNMAKWAWRTHTRDIIHRRISLNILLRWTLSKYLRFISWKFEFINFKPSSFTSSCYNWCGVGKAI